MPKVTSGGATNAWETPPEPQPAAEPPSAKAPKADLVEHAVNVAGVDPEAAQQMTKNELAATIAAAPAAPATPAALLGDGGN